MTSVNGASAFNAGIRVGEALHVTSKAQWRRAADMADAVRRIEAKLGDFDSVNLEDLDAGQVTAINRQKAALRDALAAAQEQAEQARAEAQKGGR